MQRGLHWLRNDLRLRDNTALEELCRSSDRLVTLFVLDDRLLASERMGAPRVQFLLDCVGRLASDLEPMSRVVEIDLIIVFDRLRVVCHHVWKAPHLHVSLHRDFVP